MKFDEQQRAYVPANNQGRAHNAQTGQIEYHKLRNYNKTKSIRNRIFMKQLDSEYNGGFSRKFQFSSFFSGEGRFGDQGPKKFKSDFKNWNNSISNNFRPDFRVLYRKICYNTIQETSRQD